MPAGWSQQWDPNSQRLYYLEQATGRTQWEVPVDQTDQCGPTASGNGYPFTQGQQYVYQSYSQDRSQDQGHVNQSGSTVSDNGYPPTSGQQNNYPDQSHQGQLQQPYGYPQPGTVAHPGDPNHPTEATPDAQKPKKSGNNTGLLAAGAGGLLLGGVVGAALSDYSGHHEGKCIYLQPTVSFRV